MSGNLLVKWFGMQNVRVDFNVKIETCKTQTIENDFLIIPI